MSVVDGLSPSGKATDSDSVISKVRILLAQLIEALPREVLFSYLYLLLSGGYDILWLIPML